MSNNFLTITTIISEIEPRIDKHNNRYFRVSVDWNNQARICYAFATDFSLKTETLQTLTTSPENLLNRLVLITYQEVENRDNGFIFTRIKEIQLIN
jgi:hypothetical protein